MAIGATKPATPAASREATAGRAPRSLETAATVPPPADDEAEHPRIPFGTMISDRYRIERVLGEGGMGVVYAAEHVLMRKEVAVKVLHADMCTMPEVVARFEREAIAAAHIEHPNVAGATDFGRLDDGACYLVLELLKGLSLRDEIAKGPIPVPRALKILRGITEGVAAAHSKGIVHRDLKPENVMLIERNGDSDFVKVLDFGIAKVDPTVVSAPKSAGKIVTRVGTVFGTPEYMAPEQAVGDTVDSRADLYSLGVMFLEMLTGKCPFTGNALSILRERILASGPPDMSGITDAGCRSIVARLLTREPEDRLQSGAELIAAIDLLLGDHKGASMPAPSSAASVAPPSLTTSPHAAITTPSLATGAPVPTTEPSNRRWLVLASLGLAAALLLMFGTFALVKALTSPPKEVSPAPTIAVTTAEPPPPSPVASTDEIEEPAPAPPPAPTVSAASARVTPHARPAPRPNRPASKKK